jgi:hypothetical protein
MKRDKANGIEQERQDEEDDIIPEYIHNDTSVIWGNRAKHFKEIRRMNDLS